MHEPFDRLMRFDHSHTRYIPFPLELVGKAYHYPVETREIDNPISHSLVGDFDSMAATGSFNRIPRTFEEIGKVVFSRNNTCAPLVAVSFIEPTLFFAAHLVVNPRNSHHVIGAVSAWVMWDGNLSHHSVGPEDGMFTANTEAAHELLSFLPEHIAYLSQPANLRHLVLPQNPGEIVRPDFMITDFDLEH
jgi:hypothetical protein